MKSPKTTISGITSIGLGVTTIITAVKAKNLDTTILTTAIAAIMSGFGLFFAKDDTPK